MRSTERHHDPIRNEHYHILKLYVSLPTSPMEYMASSHISGDNVAINLNDAVGEPSRRRLKGGGVFPPRKMPSVDKVSWERIDRLDGTLQTQRFSFDDSSTQINWLQYSWNVATKGVPQTMEQYGEHKHLYGIMWGKHDSLPIKTGGL